MNDRMKRKVYPDRVEYIHYPFTEEEAREAIWPCDICKHNLGCHTPEKESCLHNQCQSTNRRVEGVKPLNFVLETSYILHSCRWGTKDTNRVATEEEQKEFENDKISSTS